MPNPISLVVVIEEVVRYLVEARADKDKVNQRGAPPIHMAALSGHVAVVQLLVDLGTDKDQFDCNGAGPLQLSAEQGQLPVVTHLTEAGCDLQKADLHGTVPLHMAALHGHLDVVRALVAAGAEKDQADHHGAVPLHMAALNGETEPQRCFRTRGFDYFLTFLKGKSHGDPFQLAGWMLVNNSLSTLTCLHRVSPRIPPQFPSNVTTDNPHSQLIFRLIFPFLQ